ncbi:MAG: hypothetical protein JW827_10335, partial [Spirochaetes bacterium]|nr:hypothetical protein [Spirochaetota bacterium]
MVFRIFLVLILFISNIDLLLSTTIEIKGKQLFVNGDPFVIRGVCYGPVPVGKTISTYNWWEDPSMYSIDFPMIKAMGANCIRTYSVVTLKAALDAAYQNGLYVIMEYPIPWNTAYSNNTTIRTQVFNQVYDMVSKWKDHPAILMWCLGHEVNYNINVVAGDLQTDATCTNRLDDWYPFLNEVAGKVHEWETPYWHPVTTGSGCFDSINMGIWRDAWHYGMDNLGNPLFNAQDAKMPNLDCWGLQTYNGPGFSPGYFEKYAAQSSKPMWIAETGCDTWNSMANVENQDI